jgi:hypothetical protein
MVIQRPQLEQIDLTQYIPPQGEFEGFRDMEHYKEKLKEWGLSSAKEAKKEFLYKDKFYQRIVSIKGFETYGKANDMNTLVIEFQNGNLSCIHPAYLKEMQQSSFGKESVSNYEEKDSERAEPETEVDAETEMGIGTGGPGSASITEPIKVIKQGIPLEEKKEKVQKAKKEKKDKIELPTEKVHFIAEVKQFAMTYNPFSEENDEVVVLQHVQIELESPIVLGNAWCSHSKTLKKFELAVGDRLEFDGKVAAKKLPKGKEVPKEFEVEEAVIYKINNPSKIGKRE